MALTGLGLVERKVLAHGARVRLELVRQSLATGERILEALLAVKDGALLRLMALLEEVLSSFAGLSPELRLLASTHGWRRRNSPWWVAGRMVAARWRMLT